jgi:hypothetical protein
MLLVEAGTGVTRCNDHATVWMTRNEDWILQSIEETSGTTHLPKLYTRGCFTRCKVGRGGGGLLKFTTHLHLL